MKNFKNILTIMFTLSMLSVSQASCNAALASENQFYIKVGTGINTINPFQIRDDDYKGKLKILHTFPLIELGVGYQFADGVRVEGVFDYYFLFHSKEKASDGLGNQYNIDSKTKAHAFFLNAYKDITHYGNLTPFVGGGIGVSTLQEEAKGYIVSNQEHYPIGSSKSKKINRLAYKMTVGVDYKASKDYSAELSYNYFNLGYNKPKQISNIQHRRYGVHGVTIAIRKSI